MELYYNRAKQTGIVIGDQLYADAVEMSALRDFFEMAVTKEVQFVLLVLQAKDDSLKSRNFNIFILGVIAYYILYTI